MAKAAQSGSVDKVPARLREDGKHAARTLRAQGEVPGVVYGHGEPRSVAFALRDAQTVQAMPRNHVFSVVTHGTKAETVRLVGMQREATTGRILHLDLERVVRGERAKATVDIHIEGEEELIKRDGVLTRLLDRLEVEGETMHLPSAVTVDVSNMQSGDHLLAGEIRIPGGVTLLTAAEAPVLQVTYAHRDTETEVAMPAAEGEAALAEAEEGKAEEGKG